MNIRGPRAPSGACNPAAPLTPINIPMGQVLEPKATGSFGMTANLDGTGQNAMFPATVDIYDSLGQMHTASVSYTQTGINTWKYSVALPAADTGGVSTPV